MAATVAAGGEVWFGDETTLREFPPLRASWARRGKQREVVISGRNGRRVIHGALNVQTGELVNLVRERSRQDDCIAFLERLAQVRPQVPKLLIWDNAPPHHPKRVLAAAAAAHVTIAWLPVRSPERNPLEDLWRLLKAVVAANRVYETVEALAVHAASWLDACLPESLLTRCGLRSSKFDWLPTYALRTNWLERPHRSLHLSIATHALSRTTRRALAHPSRTLRVSVTTPLIRVLRRNVIWPPDALRSCQTRSHGRDGRCTKWRPGADPGRQIRDALRERPATGPRYIDRPTDRPTDLGKRVDGQDNRPA